MTTPPPGSVEMTNKELAAFLQRFDAAESAASGSRGWRWGFMMEEAKTVMGNDAHEAALKAAARRLERQAKRWKRSFSGKVVLRENVPERQREPLFTSIDDFVPSGKQTRLQLVGFEL